MITLSFFAPLLDGVFGVDDTAKMDVHDDTAI
jgi:hypothetical protein